jgi:hypothetical protein
MFRISRDGKEPIVNAGFRCLNCGVPWRSFAHSSPFAISKRIRCCPFCGQDIDTEMVPKPHKEDFD